MGDIGTSYTAFVATLENNMAILKKFNIEFSFDPAVPLLGIYPRKYKTYVHTETCTQMLAILSVEDGGGQGRIRQSPDWVFFPASFFFFF